MGSLPNRISSAMARARRRMPGGVGRCRSSSFSRSQTILSVGTVSDCVRLGSGRTASSCPPLGAAIDILGRAFSGDEQEIIRPHHPDRRLKLQLDVSFGDAVAPSPKHPRTIRRQHGAALTPTAPAERGSATIKDPATVTIARVWCRLMGLAALTLFKARRLSDGII